MRRHVRTLGAVPLTTAAALMALVAGEGLAEIVLPAGSPSTTGVPVGEVLIGAVLVLCVCSVAARETTVARRAVEATVAPTRADAANALAVILAAPVTRWLAVGAGLGVVVASALVGLLAGILVPNYEAPAYCGSFVGMVAPGVLAGLVPVIAAGAVAGLAYVAADGVFDGFGGKLGTTAFVGCGAVALGTGATPGSGSLPGVRTAALLVGVAGAAAPATFVVSVRLDRGPVVGSAAVGLVAGLVAPPLLAGGGTVAAAAFCASFIGMVSPDRLPDGPPVALAGLVSGLVFVGAMPAFVGFGGKLGTIAFTSCLLTGALLSAAPGRDPVERWTASR
ncbi:MAG: hypothetical protein ABEJ05_08290 [Haloglomus sp.]